MPIQEWTPTGNYSTYAYNTGVLSPVAEQIIFTIRDVIGNYEGDGYTDFRLTCEPAYNAVYPVAWLNPTCYQGQAYPSSLNRFIPYTNGMSFSFTPEFQNLSQLSLGPYFFNHFFRIDGLNSSGVWITGISQHYFTTTLNVSNEAVIPVFSFSPETITFTHNENTTFPSQSIAMTGNLWKVVGKPNFVFSSITPGVTITTVTDTSGTYQTASGSGEATITITLGSYYDTDTVFLSSDLTGTFTVLENNVAFGSIAFTVTVNRILDWLVSPYKTGEKAFTLDTKYFELSSVTPATYFQFDAKVKTYDFFTNVVNEYTILQKAILFKGKSRIYLGQIIHRLMRKFPDVNESLLQYKEAILQVTCTEKLILDNSILRTGTSTEIPFLAGLSRGMTTLGFLDFNPSPNRVTKNSFAYLNILIPLGSYELRTFKNGTLVNTVALPTSTGVVICKKVLFSAYEKGDLIQYIVDVVGQTNASAPKKTYILFPENNYSNMIVWENEFMVQSAIECTGSASIESEGEFQSQTAYVDLVERIEHLSSSKTPKLNINTGWLLFSDIDTVESLMRCKRAWLVQGNATISIRPIGKKLPKKDLEEELISFPLEFKINQNYNEETYSL